MDKTLLAEACDIRHLLNRVMGGWSPLVLTALDVGERRFSHIAKDIPTISRRMLAKTLRILEEDGLVLRKVEPTKPISVHYRLSDLGTELLPLLKAIAQWAEASREKVQEARSTFSGGE